MSNWSETQLTAKGLALDAKVTAGLTTLSFTKMKIGSGNVTPEEIAAMTDLKSPRLVIGISSCAVSESDPTICSIIGVASSDDVETSFLVKEQGLYATDPDEGEILYAVMIDSEPDKMPNQDVPSPLSIMYQINVVSDNASSITAVIDPAGLVTVQTMNAAINAHNGDDTAHKNLYGSFLRQPSTAYAQGAVVYLPSIGAGLYLECTTAGTTGSGDLVISTPLPNDTVTDGTVTWTLRKLGSGDGMPLGTIISYSANGSIPSGFLECDGSAVSRTMFPDLFDRIGTTYGAGDGSTTFNLPDAYTSRKVLYGASTAGTVVTEGLPNITGTYTAGTTGGSDTVYQGFGVTSEGTGALSAIQTGTNKYINQSSTAKYNAYGIDFDASNSDPIYGASSHVQVNGITMRMLIKAFDGQTPDSALIDITQYSNELAQKANRQLSNLDTANLSVHVVVDSYYNSSTGDWYRVYDDGWVEQGGRISTPADITAYNITLLKAMADTSYTAQLSITIPTNSNYCAVNEILATRTTTGFEFRCYYYSGSLSANDFATWTVCGMGASV